MAQQAQNDHYRRRPRAGARVRRRRPRGDRRPVRRRRRHRPARRAVAAGAPGRGPAYGAEAVTRARRGRRRAGARAPVLRLRRDGLRAPRGLLVPARAGRHARRHDLGRDGAVAPRPGRRCGRCAGKGIALGVLDLSTPEVETPETVADRVRRALDHVDVDRLVLSSDCGLKYLPRASAAGKMRALAEAAAVLRAELSGTRRTPDRQGDLPASRGGARSDFGCLGPRWSVEPR